VQPVSQLSNASLGHLSLAQANPLRVKLVMHRRYHRERLWNPTHSAQSAVYDYNITAG